MAIFTIYYSIYNANRIIHFSAELESVTCNDEDQNTDISSPNIALSFNSSCAGQMSSHFLKFQFIFHHLFFCSENQRLEEIETAFLGHDFETFGKITMQDSNQFHAVCQDTYPPIFYMNDMSKSIIRLVHVINAHFGCIKAAYTFDAGPNAVIYCLDEVLVNL